MECAVRCEFINQISPNGFICELYKKGLILIPGKDRDVLIRCKSCEKAELEDITRKMDCMMDTWNHFIREMDHKLEDIYQHMETLKEQAYGPTNHGSQGVQSDSGD